MNNMINILNDKLIFPLQKMYEIEFFYSEEEEGFIEYRFNCKCKEYDRLIMCLKLHLYYGEYCKEAHESPGEKNFLTFITYLDGEENEENGGRELKIGIINLDNEQSCINSINSIVNGLKEFGFTINTKDLSKNLYGKVLIRGYDEFFLENPDIKIYKNGKVIGRVKRKGIWTGRFNEDTILTLKMFSYSKVDVKIRSDVNNEITLFFKNTLEAKTNYYTNDIDIQEVENSKKNDIYLNWSKKQYSIVILRRIIYTFLIVFSIIKLHGSMSMIIFWLSLIALFINSTRYHTKWKNISGPKYLKMDQVYEFQIIGKLIPRLNYNLQDYRVEVLKKPIEDDPSCQTYMCSTPSDKTLTISFYNRHEEMKNEKHYKYPMLVKYSYGNVMDKTIGEIDLSNSSHIQEAINLIISKLESDYVINRFIQGGDLK